MHWKLIPWRLSFRFDTRLHEEIKVNIQSRIPEIPELSFDGALMWFSTLQCEGLLFHPEDDPGDIVRADSGAQTFTESEVDELRCRIRQLETALGHDQMIEAAYPGFMNAFGLRLDA